MLPDKKIAVSLAPLWDIRPDLSPGGHQNVFCFSPQSLHVYGTRTCPESAETRFGAPHFPHFVSMRVCPCLTVTVLRSKASFTKRSVSSRIVCFDISCLFACCTAVNAIGRSTYAARRQVLLAIP